MWAAFRVAGPKADNTSSFGNLRHMLPVEHELEVLLLDFMAAALPMPRSPTPMDLGEEGLAQK